MSQTELLSPDGKGEASLTLKEVITRTRNNFPDPRFRPRLIYETQEYVCAPIYTHPYGIKIGVDGTGTKPEMAERLADACDNPTYFESLAFDVVAMVESDKARFGEFTIAIANVIDTNTADPVMVSALARGLERACNIGGYPCVDGETAELGYRTPGWGSNRLNWNACAVGLVVEEKLLKGEKLRPGLPLVAFREPRGLRSNGYTKAREILEAHFLSSLGYRSKEEYFQEGFKKYLTNEGVGRRSAAKVSGVTLDFLNKFTGHNYTEQLLIPWHEFDREVAKELLQPSTLYAKVMHQAQGGVDGPREINMVAAAHISGGGVPEKLKRMLYKKGLGAHLDQVFPDPPAVTTLMKMAEGLTKNGKPLITGETACKQWNRGVGFVIVTETNDDAKRLTELANDMGYEAAIPGATIEKRQIEWCGHTFPYSSKAT